MFFLVLFFIVSLSLQGSVTTIPLVLILLINLAIAAKDSSVFLIAFVCGLILDVMLGNTLGITSIFYMSIIVVIFLYERKFDIQTYPFVFFSSFLGSFLYLILFGARFVFLQSLFTAAVSILFFFLLITADRFHIRKKSTSLSYER